MGLFGTIGRIVTAPVRIAAEVVEATTEAVGVESVGKVVTLPARAASGVVERSGDAIDEAIDETSGGAA